MTGDGRPLSWMDAKVNGQAVVRREGYLVEVNALWYNALCFYREALPQKWTPELEELLGRVQQSFCDTFINQHGYLFDYVPPTHLLARLERASEHGLRHLTPLLAPT